MNNDFDVDIDRLKAEAKLIDNETQPIDPLAAEAEKVELVQTDLRLSFYESSIAMMGGALGTFLGEDVGKEFTPERVKANAKAWADLDAHYGWNLHESGMGHPIISVVITGYPLAVAVYFGYKAFMEKMVEKRREALRKAKESAVDAVVVGDAGVTDHG